MSDDNSTLLIKSLETRSLIIKFNLFSERFVEVKSNEVKLFISSKVNLLLLSIITVLEFRLLKKKKNRIIYNNDVLIFITY